MSKIKEELEYLRRLKEENEKDLSFYQLTIIVVVLLLAITGFIYLSSKAIDLADRMIVSEHELTQDTYVKGMNIRLLYNDYPFLK